jgi:hypothetical protein
VVCQITASLCVAKAFRSRGQSFLALMDRFG